MNSILDQQLIRSNVHQKPQTSFGNVQMTGLKRQEESGMGFNSKTMANSQRGNKLERGGSNQHIEQFQNYYENIGNPNKLRI